METSPLFKELISEEYRNEMLKLIQELDLHLISFNRDTTNISSINSVS